ncbi:hypothetical protein GLAREA_12892 [Glarea lozoyensis ATCC 20868]|uniref:Apple domain-containing protein n=1 Tax=Glarea lozoyensis (strain ATCC 20868 / MF5171) TaxID=1116229 RepID=S3CZ19_GLAL2|nr:uncharacterized protein GLAREA_12892 [Glarea lozoyensis ATCC 20868]EPE30169.1 hypothetical protein GLAREA_12892 [Glarea lozoyensis ATCC 20868]
MRQPWLSTFTVYMVVCTALPLVNNYAHHVSTITSSTHGSTNESPASIELARSKFTVPAPNLFIIEIAPTTTFTSTRSEQDQPNTQSIQSRSSAVTATSSSTAPIATKANVDGCNQQGIATSLLQSHLWGTTKALDVLECQRRCMTVSQCISYSFRIGTTSDDSNCVFYHMFTANGTNAVVPSETSGIFFSDKYPEDGSNFCYAVVSSN